MKVSAYEKIFPVVDAEDREIPSCRVLLNGIYGAVDVVSAETAEKIERGEPEGLPAEVRAELRRRGHLTECVDEREEMRLVARLSKYVYGRRGLTLTIFPTYDCNFRCPYCFEKQRLARGTEWLSKRMSEETLDAVFAAIEKRRDAGVELGGVTLSGGEPLMAENMETVRAIAERAKAHDMPLHAVTNGYDLEVYLDLMQQFSFQSVQVTLDGVGEVNDRRRVHKSGAGSYERIVKNIGLALDRNIAVSLRVNVSRENLGCFPELVEELTARGFLGREGFHCYFATLIENNAPGGDGIAEREIMDVLAGMGIEDRRALGMLQRCGAMENRFRLWLDGKNYPPLTPAHCGAEQGAVIVDPSGLVYTCWDFVGRDENATGYVDMGTGSFCYNLLEYKWRARTSDYLARCQSCPYVFLCAGGCAAMAVRESGSEWNEFCGSVREDVAYLLPRLAGEMIGGGSDTADSPIKHFGRNGASSFVHALSKDVKPVIDAISEDDRRKIWETRDWRVMNVMMRRTKTRRGAGEN